MEELLLNVNWVAVIVGAVVAFLVGWVWYSPVLFQKKWLAGIKIDENDNSSMMPAMIAQAIGTFLLAWVIGITETTDSLSLAILIAITIALIVKANGLYTQKSKYAIMTESGYIIVMVIIMVLTHAVL